MGRGKSRFNYQHQCTEGHTWVDLIRSEGENKSECPYCVKEREKE